MTDTAADPLRAILARLDSLESLLRDQAQGITPADRTKLDLLVPALRALRGDAPATAAQIIDMAAGAPGQAGQALHDALATFRSPDPSKALGRLLTRADGLAVDHWRLKVVRAARDKDGARYVVIPGFDAQ